jgi:anti-sigma28 factor (negative regulator of flagellin synthesis)
MGVDRDDLRDRHASDGIDCVATMTAETRRVSETRIAMNPINRVSGVSPLQNAQSTAKPAAAEQSTGVERGSDRLDLSGVQNYLQTLRTNDVRIDKVSQVKAQIEAGTYETDEKLDIAAGRLLEDL